MVQDLSNVLKAARRTLFYGPRLGIIADAPVVTIAEFYAQRNTFNDPAACPRRPEFHYPIQPSPNVAVLISGFRAAENMRMISDIRREELERLSGWAFAAPVGLLRDVETSQCALEFPLVVFTGPRFGVLTPEDRELLWNIYGVPVYEQMLGIGNELLAEECDAHEGFHVRDAAFESIRGQLVATAWNCGSHIVLRLATGVSGKITEAPCPCGRGGLRLVDVQACPQASAAKA